MTTMSDRFRAWYEHERDSNAKSLAMLESVPEERRSEPEYQKALNKMGHLVAARRRWLFRLGHWPESPAPFPETSLNELPGLISETEAAWTQYLATLDDTELARELEWQLPDGRRFRWNVEGILTQTNGHAWYHRGQIGTAVANLGGKFVDTDYIYFCNLTPVTA